MLDNQDVAMACADGGPTPLASTTVGGSDGTSCTWGIAMKLGANEAFDALECCHLAGHRWAWFAGGARSWRRDFEFHVQNKLAEHLNTHQPDAEEEDPAPHAAAGLLDSSDNSGEEEGGAEAAALTQQRPKDTEERSFVTAVATVNVDGLQLELSELAIQTALEA